MPTLVWKREYLPQHSDNLETTSRWALCTNLNFFRSLTWSRSCTRKNMESSKSQYRAPPCLPLLRAPKRVPKLKRKLKLLRLKSRKQQLIQKLPWRNSLKKRKTLTMTTKMTWMMVGTMTMHGVMKLISVKLMLRNIKRFQRKNKKKSKSIKPPLKLTIKRQRKICTLPKMMTLKKKTNSTKWCQLAKRMVVF